MAERLEHVTSVSPAVDTVDLGERQYCSVCPEIMCELVNDSDDEGAGTTLTYLLTLQTSRVVNKN